MSLSKITPDQIEAFHKSGPSRVLAPIVETEAKPLPKNLLQARAALQSQVSMGKHVQAFKEGKMPKDALADTMSQELSASTDMSSEEAWEAALYLVDELDQLGAGTVLVDNDTGKAVAVITEKDMWQGPAVPRESGAMATPLPRIHPEIEGFLTCWHSENKRYEGIRKDVDEKLAPTTTELLRVEGDPRGLVATPKGRKQLLQPLIESDTRSFFSRTVGMSGRLLGHFRILKVDEELPSDLDRLPPVMAIARSVTSLAETRNFNLKFDRTNHLRSIIPLSWVKDVAFAVSMAAVKKALCFKVRPDDIIVAPPELRDEIEAKYPNNRMVLIEGARPIALRKGAGVIRPEEGHRLRSIEMNDRWFVATEVKIDIAVDWDNVFEIDVTGMAVRGVVANP